MSTPIMPLSNRILPDSDPRACQLQRDFDLAHHVLSFQSTKWSVFFIASLTAISGLVLICLGIYSLSSESTVLGQRTLPLFMLILGALVFLISFVGIFGTVTQSRGLLYGFLAGLLMLIIAQLVIGIIALANQGVVDNLLDDAWQRAYDTHPRIIRDVQEERGCCGFRYTTDRAIPKTTPDACLKSIEFGHQVACMRLLISPYRHLQYIIGISSIILAGLQIVAVLLSYLMLQHLPQSKGLQGTGHDSYGRGSLFDQERRQLLATDLYGNVIPSVVDDRVHNQYHVHGTGYSRGALGIQSGSYPHMFDEHIDASKQAAMSVPQSSVPEGELRSSATQVHLDGTPHGVQDEGAHSA